MEKPKILIVDDEPVNIELLEGILSKNYQIIKAYNGIEALETVKNNFPDLVLLDIVMPDMNGYEICKQMKNNYETMSIPIIIVTVLKEKENRIEAITAGADDFIIKPIDIDILNARVESLLTTKKKYYIFSYQDSFQPAPGKKDTYRVMEDIVKNHLEMLILKLLYERPMCGYEIIKEIHSKYNVLLSLGTVYPFLYSLKKEGIVNIQFPRGDMRTKIYFATAEGRKIIEKRINEFIIIEEYILGIIKNGGLNA
ncbi:MAG: response regulator [Candidatus Methanoperedens sp.]|nr:response regulator [Candidatus Methanoperedens sp.]